MFGLFWFGHVRWLLAATDQHRLNQAEPRVAYPSSLRQSYQVTQGAMPWPAWSRRMTVAFMKKRWVQRERAWEDMIFKQKLSHFGTMNFDL